RAELPRAWWSRLRRRHAPLRPSPRSSDSHRRCPGARGSAGRSRICTIGEDLGLLPQVQRGYDRAAGRDDQALTKPARRTMFRSMVVGTDGSDTASQAVRQAVDLARAVGAKLELVSAYEPVPKQRLR